MSLIACPVCGRSVSSAAPACPQCGHPLALPAAAPGAGTGAARLPGVPGPEEPLWWGKPSAKAMFGSILATVALSLVVLVAVLLGYRPVLRLIAGLGADAARFIRQNDAAITVTVAGLVAILLGIRLFRLAWKLMVLKSHQYRITNQRITVESGVFSKRIEELDMRTVQDFKLEQSLIERLLRIGDITIISSDRTTGFLVLVGLPDPREMRELVRTTAYQATHGQLFTRQT